MIKTQYPWIDDLGNEREDLIKTYTDDETKVLLQVETGYMYDVAIDVYPCRFTYQEVDKPEEAPESGEDENLEPGENDPFDKNLE